jgi:hypothetical protein
VTLASRSLGAMRCQASMTGPCKTIGLCVLAVVLVAFAAPPNTDWKVPPTRDFPLAGGNYAGWRYSALDQINTSTVTQLGGAWFIRLEEGRRGGQLDGTPVLVALDFRTGAYKWHSKTCATTSGTTTHPRWTAPAKMAGQSI